MWPAARPGSVSAPSVAGRFVLLTIDLPRLPFRDKSYDFTNCCNKHDLCYGTCGSDKATCDQEFKACANRQCSREEKKAECRSTVSYYMIGLKMVECPMFTSAQEAACDCARGDDDEM
jgi:hypothetical protein